MRKYRRHRREAGPKTRRYFVDACHPVWGLELLYCCWLLVGQRYYVGVGSGRKRLNILGAYSPDDHDYVDLRLTKENINGEQFVKLLEKLLAKHPETEKFILYLDNARYYSKPVVKEWLARHRQFHLVFLPAYSPNLNLIERLWKFLRKKALNRWHKTFEAMQEAVAEVLDHLERYRPELDSLMSEKFHILKDEELPSTRPLETKARPSPPTSANRHSTIRSRGQVRPRGDEPTLQLRTAPVVEQSAPRRLSARGAISGHRRRTRSTRLFCAGAPSASGLTSGPVSGWPG